MALRKIAKLGNQVLRRVAEPVVVEQIGNDELNKLIHDMIETMHQERGIGIAAPQVGVGLQLAIVNADNKPFAIINPKITKHSSRTEATEEGCLSIPGVFGIVERYQSVTVSYLNQNGTAVTQSAVGLLARVFQHEIDHLNGVLFIDRTSKITQGQL